MGRLKKLGIGASAAFVILFVIPMIVVSQTTDSDNQAEIPQPAPESKPQVTPSLPEGCHGHAACFTGKVTRVIDGDTIEVNGASVRFALVDTPELGESGYDDARSFVASLCPVGSAVLVDQDDLQTGGSYGRIIGLVFCDGSDIALNQAVLDADLAELIESFCSTSEFAGHDWAIRYGCTDSDLSHSESVAAPSCDPSYPDVCIPSFPPDLDCGEISYKNFRVIGSDPHRFDGDGDGIGCES